MDFYFPAIRIVVRLAEVEGFAILLFTFFVYYLEHTDFVFQRCSYTENNSLEIRKFVS